MIQTGLKLINLIKQMRWLLDLIRIKFFLKKNYTVGILLASGLSTRFNSDIPKQLYLIDGKPVIEYSIEILSKTVDKIIIVTNDKCYKSIQCYKSKNIFVLNANTESRTESINAAWEYLLKVNYSISNVVIHDSARPFITTEMVNNVLLKLQSCVYSQYCLKLTNGLFNISTGSFEDRDNFMETCTPIGIDYSVFNFIHKHYHCTIEFIPIINLLKLDYLFITGEVKHLRKITTVGDLTKM